MEGYWGPQSTNTRDRAAAIMPRMLYDRLDDSPAVCGRQGTRPTGLGEGSRRERFLILPLATIAKDDAALRRQPAVVAVSATIKLP